MSIDDVLHTLIDVVSGRKASLSSVEADELHQAVGGLPPAAFTEEDAAALAALQAKQAAAEVPVVPEPAGGVAWQG